MSVYETYLTNKQAAFDLPDLQVNPRNKMTRLMKNLKWGIKVNGKPESPDETTFIFNMDPKTKYEVIGDDNSNIASCVDLTNRVVKNMKGVGSLATLTSDGGVPHLTPLFKHKGKYYLVHGEHQYSAPYNSLNEVGDRWYTDPSVPVPKYVDFYNLPADETITETNLRKVIEEIKRKAKNTYRKDYTHREGYKLRNDKYTIHGAILGCLGNNAKKFDYNITEKLPNDPWKAIINTKPMTMEQVQQFHKYHRKDVDKAGVPYYFLTRNERTGEKAVWYSDDATPLPINNKKEIEYAQQVGRAKGLVPDQLNFKFTKEAKAINFPEEELANLKGKDHFYTTRVSSDYDKYNLGDTVTTPWGDAYDIVSEDKYNSLKDHKFYDELTDDQKRLLAAYKKIKLLGLTKKSSVEEYDVEKARKFVEAVRQMARRRKLNVFVLTDGASGVSNNGNPAIRNARNAQIQWELENGYDPYEDWGTKQASRLYTYVDPEADLSKGLLSARLAPEDILMRRYQGHDYATSKENILKFFKEHNEKSRVDSIYALDTPIPDNANEQLLKFRNARKLVSFDAEDIKDLVRILRRRTGKPPIEVTPDFEPRKHVQWGRDPSKVMKNPGRGPFHYAPVYKLLTESGRIPPELLTYE